LTLLEKESELQSDQPELGIKRPEGRFLICGGHTTGGSAGGCGGQATENICRKRLTTVVKPVIIQA